MTYVSTINHDALHPLMEEGGIICFLAAKIEQFVSVLVLGVQKGRNLFYWVPVQWPHARAENCKYKNTYETVRQLRIIFSPIRTTNIEWDLIVRFGWFWLDLDCDFVLSYYVDM